MSYTVFATVPVKPQHIDAACKAVAAIVPATIREKGCISFKPHRAADGSNKILIFEEWADRSAFEFHHAQEYTKDVYTQYESWLEGAPVIVEAVALEGGQDG